MEQSKFYQIKNITEQEYTLVGCDGSVITRPIQDVDKSSSAFTIQDAEDGDVLAYVTDEEDLWIMIYRSLYEPYEGHVHYHALLVNDKFSDKGTCCICINGLKPATKEQRDLLFSKMQEAGYVWDAEKKELKKIEKQGEQKSAWSEEDENFFANICTIIDADRNFTESAKRKCKDWFKSLKDRMI